MELEQTQKRDFVLKVARRVRQEIRTQLSEAVEAEDWLTVKKIADLLLRAEKAR